MRLWTTKGNYSSIPHLKLDPKLSLQIASLRRLQGHLLHHFRCYVLFLRLNRFVPADSETEHSVAACKSVEITMRRVPTLSAPSKFEIFVNSYVALEDKGLPLRLLRRSVTCVPLLVLRFEVAL